MYATGAFGSATPVLDVRGSELSKFMCGFFIRNLLGIPEISSTNSILAGFCSQKLWGLIFLALEPCAEGPAVKLGLLAPEISLLNFYLPHVCVGSACSTSLPLPPVRMDVVYLIP